MSRMQEAFFRKGYDCTKPHGQFAAACEAVAQEPSSGTCQENTCNQPDRTQSRRNSILWMVRNPRTNGLRPAAKKNTGLISSRTARGRSDCVRVSIPRQEANSPRPREKTDESVSTQIKRFQGREDLRECLLPGMLSKISQKACEGWQRQASVRTSRVLARMKLDPCKRCQYRLEADNVSS